MSKTYDFLQECGVFFLSTISDDVPSIRPFGAVMEYRDELYISTTNNKDVYNQLKKNPTLQIMALKTGTRTWIRVSGNAVEETDISIKKKMLETCPVLSKHFTSPECKEFVVFCIKDSKSLLCTDSGKEKIS